MQSAAFDRADLGWSDGDQVLEAVRKIATEDLSPVANKIDQEGFYPSEIMRDLCCGRFFVVI